MDTESVLRVILQYFQNLDGAKALQITYYSVALVLASIGLWKAIRYAEGKMPKRLLEFASRPARQILQTSKEIKWRWAHMRLTNGRTADGKISGLPSAED